MIETLITKQLPDMRPVLLLDMRIVVLLVGTRTGEGGPSWMQAEVAQQVMIEKLASVILIESAQLKRQHLLNCLDLIQYTG